MRPAVVLEASGIRLDAPRFADIPMWFAPKLFEICDAGDPAFATIVIPFCESAWTEVQSTWIIRWYSRYANAAINSPIITAKILTTFLSGGQQQRVAIARALMNDPKIIVADEPTGNLDTKTGQGVFNLLKILSSKFRRTIIMVTHNPELAATDRTIYLRDGAIEKEIIKWQLN
jgi:hypothetical protein